MTPISTRRYLFDRARRRFAPTLNNIPGMGAVEQRMLTHEFTPKVLAEPPAGSGLKPVVGNSGLPVVGHTIEFFRSGPDFALQLYRRYGPLFFSDVPLLGSVNVLGPDATRVVFANKNKDFSQRGWHPVIGPFFNRGLMLLDFDEHLAHRRVMQEAFTRPRLASYVEHIDRVVTASVADFPADDARFLMQPAAKKLTLDIASTVFMGHQPDTDDGLVTKVNNAFTTTTRAGGAIIRFPLPPFKWWRGLRARKVLEKYFAERVTERRGTDGTDMLTVLCHSEDDDGNSFSDADIVNHMIMLLMAAHDTSTSAITTMAYHLAAHPEWQDRCRDESARLGDGPLDIDSLEKLESLGLVMNESLRLVPPLPFVMRQTVRDTDLLGYYLPAGTLVMAWPGVNHRLPELWTAPDRFDPERFAEPRAEHKAHRYGFVPFGGGAHKCIGSMFAQLQVKTVLHRMLRRYRLELAYPGYQPRWDHGGMPIPIDGMPIVLRPLGSGPGLDAYAAGAAGPNA
jgi:cytochrome P450